MKKLSWLILVVLVILAVAGLFAYKLLNKPAENNVETITPIGSAIQNAMYSDENEINSAVNDNKNEQTEEVESVSVIKKAVKKVQKKFLRGNADNKEMSNSQKSKVENLTTDDENINNERKFTPEEEELLKKVPRADEVVVDKEIKLKSSGKYIFK